MSSYSQTVELGKKPVIVGERINPTGKKLMKAALRENDINYLIKEGIAQKDKGAHILDVNVGLPEIDEPAMMQQALFALQGVRGSAAANRHLRCGGYGSGPAPL